MEENYGNRQPPALLREGCPRAQGILKKESREMGNLRALTAVSEGPLPSRAHSSGLLTPRVGKALETQGKEVGWVA